MAAAAAHRTGSQLPRDETRRLSGSSPLAAAISNPDRMLLLAPYAVIENENRLVSSDCHANNADLDPDTAAFGITSSGHLIRVFLRPAPPPALSRVSVHFPEFPRDLSKMYSYSTVIAAHGDSVLIFVYHHERGYFYHHERGYYWGHSSSDYFVYSPGIAAAGDARQRPPSLRLLPSFYYPTNRNAIGLLHDEEAAELVVAKLRMVNVHDAPKAPELLLLRAAAGECRVTWPRISSHYDDDEHPLPDSFEPHAAVPLGRRQLCWVDSAHGITISDVFADNPALRFVPFPEAAVAGCVCVSGRRRLREPSYVCVTARGEVKLVCVSPGGPCSDDCRRCSDNHAGDITTWTLKAEGGVAAAWVVEDEAMGEESAELRAIDDMDHGLARVQLVYPLANMDGGGRRVAGKRAASTEEEDERNMRGKGRQKRGAESTSSSPRRSKRASKRNVRVTGKEWVN